VIADSVKGFQSLATPGPPSQLEPEWAESLPGEYEPWNREHIEIDRRGMSMAEIVRELREALEKRQRNPGQI
jgi:hypothetical protein